MEKYVHFLVFLFCHKSCKIITLRSVLTHSVKRLVIKLKRKEKESLHSSSARFVHHQSKEGKCNQYENVLIDTGNRYHKPMHHVSSLDSHWSNTEWAVPVFVLFCLFCFVLFCFIIFAFFLSLFFFLSFFLSFFRSFVCSSARVRSFSFLFFLFLPCYGKRSSLGFKNELLI